MARNSLVAFVISLLLSATAGEIVNGTQILDSKTSDGTEQLRSVEIRARVGEEGTDESAKKISSGDSTETEDLPEDCGTENSCADVKNNFVACLRVPGDESTSLLLLIINKGSGSLTINIHGLKLVNLEDTAIHLQGNKHKKVLVKADPAEVNFSVNLTSGDVNQCQLIYSRNDGKVSQRGRLLYPASFVYLALAALALSIAVSLATKVRRARRKPVGALPISSGGDGGAAGWDGGWEESWGSEDEETPPTPSTAVSSPSLKRLAPRRSGKLEHTA